MFSTGHRPLHPLTRTLRRRPRVGRAAFVLAVAAVLANTVPTAQASVAPHGDTSRCGGRGVDATALVRYESDIVIKAPLSTVWKLQTDVERWPSWQPPVITSERLGPGRLKAGSQFRWTTPAPATTLVITSTVQELQRHDCILWSGPATGEGLRIDEGVHLWTFREAKDGVHVHTEETWTGTQIETDVPTATAALGASLEAWLHDLKTTAEA